MSGEKYTQIQLQRERQEKLNLLQSLQSLLAECTALRKQLEDKVNGISEGLRSTFTTEVAASRQWLQGTTPVGKYGIGLDAVRQAQQQQEQRVNAGRSCLQNLQLALTQKADAIGRAVAEQRVVVSQLLLQHSEVLRLWYGAETVGRLEFHLELSERDGDIEVKVTA